MELAIPILFSMLGIVLMLFSMMVKHSNDELFLLSMILSTIFMFVGGACWLGVTYVDPVTGDVLRSDSYNLFSWIFIGMGFVPIMLLYEFATSGLDGRD